MTNKVTFKKCRRILTFQFPLSLSGKIIFINPHSYQNGFYCGHKCSWTLTPANCIQVAIMQSDDSNRGGGQSGAKKMKTHLTVEFALVTDRG